MFVGLITLNEEYTYSYEKAYQHEQQFVAY